ncbi:MAG TPA: hypothetical protein PK079_01530 [Leptospiraceae bacterium]|nr:hypothetical protein [Leptospiraceae bacterium]HMX35221.1 hypothetical protein [Leptospiraceae bacterium]HMY33527.1 hypothetical protein [Leptospiraceae bacterium]HMZ66114.1 hypothetical protein [Leptospiraceae bacterium]HNA09718.1 hypothetical protein [Leptospiraceae bacterium]
MKTYLKLIFALILFTNSFILFSEEKKSGDDFIKIWNLLWEKNIGMGGLVWNDAIQYSKQKGLRLPTNSEFLSNIEFLDSLEDDSYENISKKKIFYATHGRYWSSTELEKDPNQAWLIHVCIPQSECGIITKK